MDGGGGGTRWVVAGLPPSVIIFFPFFSLHLGRMLQRLFCLSSISVAMGRAFQEVIVGVINWGLVSLWGIVCVSVCGAP